MMLKPRTW